MQKYIVITLISLLIGFGIFTGFKIDSLKDQLAKANNLAAQRDTITIIGEDSTLFRKAALEVKKLQTENSDLKRDLKITNSKLKSETQLVGFYKSHFDSISTIPSITMGDSVREFETEKDSLNLKGYFYTISPYTLSITDIRLGLGLNIFLAEDKNGHWNTYIETKTPNIKFSQLNTQVVPYKRSWYNKIYFLGEATLVGQTDIGVGIGYEKWGHFTYSLDETGARTIRIGKTWYPFSGGK